jgi:hypothetical protein
MKIDFNRSITGLEGATVIEPETKKPLTLATMAVTSLVSPIPDARGQPEQLDGVSKVRFASLAERIFLAKEPVDLTVEDVAAIKERIGRGYGPVAVMRAWAMLEGEAE